MSHAMKPDGMMLGLALIVGAVIWSRSNRAYAGTAPGVRPSSVPGNVGSGAKQVVGGLLSSLYKWTPWEPLQGVDHDPASPTGFVSVTDIVNAGIENEPVYQVQSVSDIIQDVSGTDVFGARPGAYWS